MPTFWHVFVMACLYHQPCQYGGHAAHISEADLWDRMVEEQHLQNENFSRTEKESRVESVGAQGL